MYFGIFRGDAAMEMTKHRVFGLLLALIATASMPSASAQDRLFSNGAKQKAEALLKQMTVDEKVGQLNESSGIVMPGIATEEPDDLIARFGGLSGQTSTNLPPPSPPPATQSTCATPAASNPVGGGGIYTQIAIDPGVYGKRDPSGLTVFGFSQHGQNLPADPQVLAMSPNIVSRAWQRWDRGGVQPSDYKFAYPMQAQAAGITFIFSGRLSYPLYITHIGFVYILAGYAWTQHPGTAVIIFWILVELPIVIFVAWLFLKFFDEPVRAWLTRRYVIRPTTVPPEQLGAAR
jgi:hypothetical protein